MTENLEEAKIDMAETGDNSLAVSYAVLEADESIESAADKNDGVTEENEKK